MRSYSWQDNHCDIVTTVLQHCYNSVTTVLQHEAPRCWTTSHWFYKRFSCGLFCHSLEDNQPRLRDSVLNSPADACETLKNGPKKTQASAGRHVEPLDDCLHWQHSHVVSSGSYQTHKYHKTWRRKCDSRAGWQLQTTWLTEVLFVFLFERLQRKCRLEERGLCGRLQARAPLQASNCCLHSELDFRKWISELQTGCVLTVIHNNSFTGRR